MNNDLERLQLCMCVCSSFITVQKGTQKASDTDIRRRLRVPPSLVFSRPHILFSDPLERLQFLKEEYCTMPVFSVVSDYDPVDCSPPVSSVQGIFQARVLEWIAIAYSKHCTIFLFKVH